MDREIYNFHCNIYGGEKRVKFKDFSFEAKIFTNLSLQLASLSIEAIRYLYNLNYLSVLLVKALKSSGFPKVKASVRLWFLNSASGLN